MTEHSPFPWHLCGEERGGCQCGQIWSKDHPVAQLTFGEWGDLPDLAYGNVSLELAMANGYVIAAVGDMVEALREILASVYETGVYQEEECVLDAEAIGAIRAALRKARLLED